MEPQTISIHGKQYIPVNERVKMIHADLKKISIQTEILYTDPAVVIRATVTTPKGVFTGISAANPRKSIENQNPFEVAETSAVGRALGFAGYGIADSIASADEMRKAGVTEDTDTYQNDSKPGQKQTYLITPKQIIFLTKLLSEKGYSEGELFAKYDVTKIDELTIEQATTAIGNLMKLPKKEEIATDELDDEVDAAFNAQPFAFKK